MSNKDTELFDDETMQALTGDDDAAMEAALRAAGGESADAETGPDTTANGSDSAAADAGDEVDTSEGASSEAEGVDKQNQAADEAAQAKAGDQESRPDAGGEEPAPISNKSGTGTIPYSVLEGSRRQAAQLREQLDEANRKLEEATKASQGGGEQTAAESNAVDRMNEALASGEELNDEEFEDLPPAIQKLAKTVQALNGRMEQVGKAAETAATKAEQSEAEQTQELIDQFEDLAAWQAKGGVLWQAAVQMDQQLKQDPDWQGKPADQRFKEVVNRVREDVGLPKRDWNATTNGQGDSKQTAKADAGDVLPTSISHIPGGGTANLDMNDSIENQSSAALGKRMEGMSDEAIDKLLAGVS